MDTEKSGQKAKTKAPSLRLRCEEWEPFDANIPVHIARFRSLI
jgi:hypothetical protein